MYAALVYIVLVADPRLIAAAPETVSQQSAPAGQSERPPDRGEARQASQGATNRSSEQAARRRADQEAARKPAAEAAARRKAEEEEEARSAAAKDAASKAAAADKQALGQTAPSVELETTNTTANILLLTLAAVTLVLIGAVIFLWRQIASLQDNVSLQIQNLDGSLRRVTADRHSGGDSIRSTLSDAVDSLYDLQTRVSRLERSPRPGDPSQPPRSGLPPSPPLAGVRATPASTPIESIVQEFCRDRIDHTALIRGADARGLRWGSGTTLRGQNRISVEFSNPENRILVIEAARDRPDYHILVREDAHWSLDLAFVFKRSGDDERTAAGREARVRTRKAGRGTLQSGGELSVDEPGLVELFAS